MFYTVFGSPEEQADSAAALASATGVIRSEVGRQTGLRHTPSLTFVPDAVPGNVRHMEDLVARARQADAGPGPGAGGRRARPVTPTPTAIRPTATRTRSEAPARTRRGGPGGAGLWSWTSRPG